MPDPAIKNHVLLKRQTPVPPNKSMSPSSVPGLQPLSPSSPAQGRLFGGRDRGSRRRRRHLVLEPLPGRALRHPDHRLQLHASIPSSRRSGRGRRSTPRSPRSCATFGFVADRTTCAATSASRPRSKAANWDEAPSRWRIRPTTATTMPAATTSWRPAACHAEAARDRRRRGLQGRGLLHRPLAARGRRLHRQAGRRHRHRLVGHPVDPDDRRAGGAAHRVPAHAELSRCPRTTARSPRGARRPAGRRSAPPTASRRAGRWPACRCP